MATLLNDHALAQEPILLTVAITEAMGDVHLALANLQGHIKSRQGIRATLS